MHFWRVCQTEPMASPSLLSFFAVNLFEQALLLWLFTASAARFALTLAFLGNIEPTHEAIDLTGGIDDALLTGVERMAIGADFNPEIGAGRANLPHRATRAANNTVSVIFGMNTLFHRRILSNWQQLRLPQQVSR